MTNSNPMTQAPAPTPTEPAHPPAGPRAVLVTGGSRGIGAATSLWCARQGWAVAVNFTRDAQAADAVVEQIRQAGGTAIALQADVADEAQVLAMYARIDAELPRLHGLVNNAGVVDTTRRFDDMTLARWQRMFEINVYGSFLCAREAIRRMSTQRGGLGGSIVNVSSVAARSGGANQYVDYAAAKGAIDTMTIGLSKELAAEGVRVNAVRPGITDTEIHASGGQPGRQWRLASQIPMQRPGTPQEIANAIGWLLSDEASYTTGALLDVTGAR